MPLSTSPAGLDLDVPTPVINVVLPAGLPTGTWTVEWAVLEPELGVTLSRDAKPFLAGRMSLASMQCTLPLTNVYDRVGFPAEMQEPSNEA